MMIKKQNDITTKPLDTKKNEFQKLEAMKTAIDWLVNELPTIDWDDPYYKVKLEEAKTMEKEQMQDAYWEGGLWDPHRGGFDAYYNETFNTEEE